MLLQVVSVKAGVLGMMKNQPAVLMQSVRGQRGQQLQCGAARCKLLKNLLYLTCLLTLVQVQCPTLPYHAFPISP